MRKDWKISKTKEDVIVYSEQGNVCRMESKSIKKDEANATLIADAGNTYNKCGMLPSELLEELNKLKTK